MTNLYEIVWQVQTDRPDLARKFGHWKNGKRLSYSQILDGFTEPNIEHDGKDLVVWQIVKGVLGAEGWRRVGG